jgi:hypothetical protein
MKEETVDELSLEPERYELYAEIGQQWEATRREFFDFVGGGIVVVYALIKYRPCRNPLDGAVGPDCRCRKR